MQKFWEGLDIFILFLYNKSSFFPTILTEKESFTT